MSIYIAAYDIAHGGRRSAVAGVLLSYGRRIQRSLYEIWLEPDDHSEFRRRIGPLLRESDEFEIFPLDTRAGRHRVRWQRDPESWKTVRLL